MLDAPSEEDIMSVCNQIFEETEDIETMLFGFSVGLESDYDLPILLSQLEPTISNIEKRRRFEISFAGQGLEFDVIGVFGESGSVEIEKRPFSNCTSDTFEVPIPVLWENFEVFLRQIVDSAHEKNISSNVIRFFEVQLERIRKYVV